ncbi:MAG TPA: sugar ABC transporter substrate-binding protein [Chloroflexota bacterium]|nr:sugar ABC transporter substrate-binding protein [Chloroflexota bacterium]
MNARRARRLSMVSLAVSVAIMSVASGMRSAEAHGSAARASAVDLAYVTAQIKQYRAIPRFIAPGPPFGARQAVKGKSLFVIPASSAVPFVQTISNNMRAVAKQVGLRYIEWPNQGQPSQWAQGMDSAINRKANSIDLLAGINPAALGPQIRAAQKAGIGTVVSHLYNVGQMPAPHLAATVDIPYEQAGRLLADWTILKARGKVDAVVVTINEVVSTAAMVRGIRGVMSAHCGAGCRLTFINVSIPEIATRIQPQVETALTRDPNINYVIALYDSAEAPFAVAAINAAGAANRVKVVTFNGTPSVLKMVQDGNVVEMDIAENLDWIARAIMDQHMRLMAGLTPVKDPHIPLRIFDKSNIRDAGTPPRDSAGFGSSYGTDYNRLWELTR